MSKKGKKGKPEGPERTVCFCYNVQEKTIVEAIVNGGCRSVMDIRREVFASSGCAGCSEEVKKILRKWIDPDTGDLIQTENEQGK